MRLHFPARRLVVVFEPHTFTWRNRSAIAQYDGAFDGAERVYIYEPATQGSHTHAQLSQGEIVARVRATGIDTTMLNGEDDLKVILGDTKQDDAVSAPDVRRAWRAYQIASTCNRAHVPACRIEGWQRRGTALSPPFSERPKAVRPLPA